MKSRNEYIESIYSKRDSYVTEQRRKRKTVLSVCIPLTICIVTGTLLAYTLPPKGGNDILKEKTYTANAVAGTDSDAEYEIAMDIITEDKEDVSENDFASTTGITTTFSSKQSVGSGAVNDESGEQPEKATASVATVGGDDNQSVTTLTSTIDTFVQETAPAIVGDSTPVTTTVPREEASSVKISGVTVIGNEIATRYIDSAKLEKIYSAFEWALDGDISGYPSASAPTGTPYKIEIDMNNKTYTFYWHENVFGTDGSSWIKISDEQKSDIKSALSNTD